ncbi:hypothetical protein POTOM_013711 [Populus tomentosa]|uniref:Disease resistance N-terminal domain-containing protein n=1 Tax=Populus tomentosa TaxID=118781 RepID=A0A8X8D7S6_POPTO|nr:hypothetical protein POTOM_013711 [Populus tomentosa]
MIDDGIDRISQSLQIIERRRQQLQNIFADGDLDWRPLSSKELVDRKNIIFIKEELILVSMRWHYTSRERTLNNHRTATTSNTTVTLPEVTETLPGTMKEPYAMEESDSALKLLVKNVRDVAYDTEDALDELIRLCLANDSGHGVFSCFRKICRPVKDARVRSRVASKIQGIKSRVISISVASEIPFYLKKLIKKQKPERLSGFLGPNLDVKWFQWWAWEDWGKRPWLKGSTMIQTFEKI